VFGVNLGKILGKEFPVKRCFAPRCPNILCRHDRLVVIAEANHMYNNIKKLKDLPHQFVNELLVFFVNYHNLEGKRYKLLGCKGKDAALTLIRKAQKSA